MRKIKKGDIVTAIKNCPHYGGITAGKSYEVLSCNEFGRVIKVRGNSGEEGTHPPDEFEFNPNVWKGKT